MRGYRNTIIGLAYLTVCALLGYWAPEHINSMGGTFGSLGLGVTGVVLGRAGNKWAEAKNGKPTPSG